MRKQPYLKHVVAGLISLAAYSSAEAAPIYYAGGWALLKSYAEGDVVSHEKQTYYALKPNKNISPGWGTQTWRLIGTLGNTVHHGAGAPIASVGKVGDFYIDTQHNRLYGPKSGQRWPTSSASMVGPKGDIGPQGVQGPAGPTGPQGVQGPAGPIGPQGTKGDIGPAGPIGDTGPQGPKGDPGTVGSYEYRIGEPGPGGGIIFFVDYFDQYPGFTYLEAAPNDLSALQTWCNLSISIPATSGWEGNAVGKGQANTDAMRAVCTRGAAYAADDYVSPSGFDDWFLPSAGEMMLMHANLRQAGLGKFRYSTYSSSTEYSLTLVVGLNFISGELITASKTAALNVRPVRAF